LKAIVLLGISSGVIWLLDILACVSVVMMFQQQIPFAIIVLAIVIGNLVKAVPLTPGGVGTYEISLAITFGLAGVDPAVATLIAIIDHLIKNLVTLAGGIVSIYYFGDWVIPSIRTALDSKFGGDRPDR
ncbi:MAG TPA: lysylphosphatidylglycerol synthase transmembrane domain-containing protein, partial [Methanoregula sp.]|nr:lysylphosphatidylglycerol synthase transmembrane domain-containing protein [Methanoregula sp.]